MKLNRTAIAAIAAIFVIAGVLTFFMTSDQRALNRGVEFYRQKDYQNAISTFLPIAQKGDPIAQLYLGWMYMRGEGTLLNVKEPKSAAIWLRRSADQKLPRSQALLALLDSKTNVVRLSKEENFSLIKQSANSGDAIGQYLLGISYMVGADVPISKVKAEMWLTLALDSADNRDKSLPGLSSDGVSGTSILITKMQMLEPTMSQEAIEEGKRLAQDWLRERADGQQKEENSDFKGNEQKYATDRLGSTSVATENSKNEVANTKAAMLTNHPINLPAINKCGIPPLMPKYASISAEGVAFEYPADITTQVLKSGNGTVYHLASPDGCMRINVYHFFNTGRDDAAAILKQEEEAHDGVTYRFKKGDTFVVAGNSEGWAYYTRGLINGKDKAYISEVEMLVPNHLVNSYGDIVAHISKSMTTAGAATATEYIEQAGDRAIRNTSRDFHRVYVNSKARTLEVDYQSDALPSNCLLGIKEEKVGHNADLAYCTQSFGDNVEAREKARWGL